METEGLFLLAPWNVGPLEELIAEIHRLLWNPNIITDFTKSSPHEPVQSRPQLQTVFN